MRSLAKQREMIAHPRVIKGDFDRGGMAEVRPEELRLLEALLFASAEPLDEQTLAARLPDGVEVRVALERLQQEYAPRGVNLVRIESRPRKQGLGRYMFFVDVEGRDSEPHVEASLAALGGHVEALRVLGSYPAWTGG